MQHKSFAPLDSLITISGQADLQVEEDPRGGPISKRFEDQGRKCSKGKCACFSLDPVQTDSDVRGIVEGAYCCVFGTYMDVAEYIRIGQCPSYQ